MSLADQGGVWLTGGRNSQPRAALVCLQDRRFPYLESLTLLPPACARKLIDQSGSAQETNHASYFKMQEIKMENEVLMRFVEGRSGLWAEPPAGNTCNFLRSTHWTHQSNLIFSSFYGHADVKLLLKKFKNYEENMF